MTETVVRPYGPSDLRVCRGLWAALTEAHRDLYDDPTIGGEDPGLAFDGHLARVGAERVWVAEVAGSVVGFAGLIVEDDEAEVEPVVVSREYRREGVGGLLVARVVAEARTLGVRYLNVRPVARNADAIRFFHQAGFVNLGHVELFMDMRPADGREWGDGQTVHGRRFRL